MPNGATSRASACEKPSSAPLRRVVGAEVRERADAADARHLDDVSAALRPQDRQRGLRHPQRAEHIGLQLRANLVLGQFLDHAELAVTGVVHDDVEPPEVLRGLLHGGEITGSVGHVQPDRQECVGVFGDDLVQGGQIAGGTGDAVASIECREGPFAAEAARYAGDEPNLVHVFSASASLLRVWPPLRCCLFGLRFAPAGFRRPVARFSGTTAGSFVADAAAPENRAAPKTVVVG